MLSLVIVVAVSIAGVTLATPAADSARHAIAPRLPFYVIVLAVISVVVQLVSAVVDMLSRSFGRRISFWWWSPQRSRDAHGCRLAHEQCSPARAFPARGRQAAQPFI
ncbi:MAG: hypothetical protein ABI884_06335 [Gemmatimonadota bacterium]